MFALKLFLVLLLLVALTISGALIFIKGFLLSRTVVDAKSQCVTEFALRAEDHSHHGVEGCWMHGRFKRAIIVIIDALKFDFLSFNSSLSEAETPPYKNKLLTLHRLKIKKPLHVRQYKFIADPPTTTMQRLKGLTTGSLPTFVDAGANFHSYEISEDNIIDQMVHKDKKIKFLGDDTWLSLFPKRFYKSFDFPSFDVKDLHTVDNGVLRYIYPEMRQSDWDILIAHFLGVDHCGHRYGPDHQAMAEKLTQMDEVLRNITQQMRDDTILFVMGDHGMTRTGDHGGDSADELEAGLFIYSPAQISSTPQTETEDLSVAQTDFVPTVSLLMGIPIPFSNLGMVIPELFSHCPWWDTASNDIRRVYHKVKALRLNAHQISMYLSAYQELASDLSVSKLRALQRQINQAEIDVQSLVTAMIAEGATSDALEKFHQLEITYKSYIRGAKEICESVWAKFDIKMILTGLLTMALGVSQCFYFFLMWDSEDENLPTAAKFLIGGSLLHLLYLAIHLTFFSESVPPLMAFTLAIVLISSTFIIVRSNVSQIKVSTKLLTTDNLVCSGILFFGCCMYFSNSFVVYEDIAALFFMQTVVCSFSIKVVLNNISMTRKENSKPEFSKQGRKTKTVGFDILNTATQHTSVTILVTLLCCVFMKLASNFYACREEQHLCEDSIFLHPLSTLEDGLKNQRYLFSVICLAAMVYCVRHWLKYYGNMNGPKPGVVCANYAPPLAVLFICLHWALQALSASALESFTQWQQVLMAQIVYGIIFVTLIVIVITPVLVYRLPSRSSKQLLSQQANYRHIIPTLYNQLKVRLSSSQGGIEDEKPPVVYGLGTVYSASLVLLVSVVSLALVLLLNDGVAPSLLIATLVLYLCLELYTAATPQGNEGDCKRSVWSGLVMFNLLSTLFFYATGHQATIPSIRFESAYTGFYGDFNSMVLPGFLIWLNTFAGPIFFNLASPLLVFWPLLSSALVQWMVKRTMEQDSKQGIWQGDFKMFDNATKLRKAVFTVGCGVLLIASLKLLSAACAAALHRRHLMVWKIFAPRFVYEGAMFVTVSVCVLLAYLFVMRVDKALSKFVGSLQLMSED